MIAFFAEVGELEQDSCCRKLQAKGAADYVWNNPQNINSSSFKERQLFGSTVTESRNLGARIWPAGFASYPTHWICAGRASTIRLH